MKLNIIENVYFCKKILKLAFLITIPLNSYSQSNLSYKQLTPMLDLLKNHLCCNTCLFYENEEPLRKKVLDLNWNLDINETFDTLYQETKDENIDYRYYLIIAKAANSHFRKTHIDNDNSTKNIDYYYKSLFLNLAIEKNNSRYTSYKDSLKYQYTEQYILSTLYDSCFPSFAEFKEFANLNIKYSNQLLKGSRLNLTKSQRSELYYIMGDAIYRTTDVEDSTKQNLSEVFKYLSLAINEDPENWRA